MSSGKLWPKLSDAPDEPSKISELVTTLTPRYFISSQQKIKPTDFTDRIDENPIGMHPVRGFDSYLEGMLQDPAKSSGFNIKGMLRGFRDIYDQDIPIQDTLESIDNRIERNCVEFHQRYTGILNEVKHEAEQARSLDSDIEEIKNEAYDEFAVVMEEIYDAGVSMPEVTWNEDGSLDIGWPLKTGGTSTILVYGDDHVIYNTYLGPDNYVESICKISDGLLLPKLIGILSNITE